MENDEDYGRKKPLRTNVHQLQHIAVWQQQCGDINETLELVGCSKGREKMREMIKWICYITLREILDGFPLINSFFIFQLFMLQLLCSLSLFS